MTPTMDREEAPEQEMLPIRRASWRGLFSLPSRTSKSPVIPTSSSWELRDTARSYHGSATRFRRKGGVAVRSGVHYTRRRTLPPSLQAYNMWGWITAHSIFS